jgi:septum site-determining protein MinC
MAAQWFEPAGPGLPVRLRIEEASEDAVAQVTAALDDRRLQHPEASGGELELDAGPSLLGASVLAAVLTQLQAEGLTLVQVVSTNPHTRVAAAALGLRWIAPTLAGASPAPDAQSIESPANLTLHRGTVRSGDQLEAAGSLLVLGDVNPGARLRAGGHVLVWGRLRGVAHAGCHGNPEARIVAMQLRPLQLRIADVVARGPEDPPPAGLAEEARLVDGAIRIDAASPIWPLSG